MNFNQFLCLLIVVLGAVAMLTGCMSVQGPTNWRPEVHVAAMQACRVACHPNGMRRYDSMDGSCECRRK